MKRLFPLLIVSAVTLAAVPADATLLTIGTADYGSGTYNLIHDDDQGLIWLDYSNARNTWQNQMNWAASLNSPGVLTYNIDSAYTLTWGSEGWRLPDTNPATPDAVWGYDGTTSVGYNITSSEMGHLYYAELGGLGYYDANGTYQPTYGLTNTGPFSNLQPGFHFSGTEYAPDTSNAWGLSFLTGYEHEVNKTTNVYALAVRPVNVAAALPAPPPDTTSVPEPGTMMLMGSGLAGLAFMRRYKKG